MRPQSIERFARLYPASILIGVVINILSWEQIYNLYARTQLRDAGLVPLVTLIVLGFAISMALWYFVTRHRSNVARWVIVAFFAISTLGMAMTLVTGRFVPNLVGLLSLARFLVQAFAVRELLRSESTAWLAGTDAETGQSAESSEISA